MSRYEFIDRIFGIDEEEEQTDDEDFETDTESEGDDESETVADEDDEPEEDAAGLARLDKAYRALRARVRACTDLSELRSIRFDQTTALAGHLTPTVRLRTTEV